MSELCTVMCAREKCASARVQVGAVSTPQSRAWQLLQSGRETARINKLLKKNWYKTKHRIRELTS